MANLTPSVSSASDPPPQEKTGWLSKFSIGRSNFFLRRNWKSRYVVCNSLGISYFESAGATVPKSVIEWDVVTQIHASVDTRIAAAAHDPNMRYFGVSFTEEADSRLLLFRTESAAEREEWVAVFTAMREESQRIVTILNEIQDDDESAEFFVPQTKSQRRSFVRRMSILQDVQVKVRTLVSLEKQRYVKDGFDLDLAYVTPSIIAMGFPSTGTEAMFRNPLPEVLRFFTQYHERRYRIYNLCSERVYPAERFHGNVERFPFDDHQPPPLALIPDFVRSASEFLAADPRNVIAVHCKAGKGRTGLMTCCLLLALGLSADANAAIRLFADKRTRDGNGIQVPSQIRYLMYYDYMLKSMGGRVPSRPREVRIDSITLSSTPRFDPDGGCDPFLMVYRRRLNHMHVALGTSEDIVSNPMEVCYDSLQSVGRPPHIVSQRNVRIELRDCILSGEYRLELVDRDTLSKDDVMFAFWIHTSFLPPTSVLTLQKSDLDEAVKDKKHELFDADFSVTLRYTFRDEE